MSKSKLVIERLAKLFEQGLVSYKDLNSEILSILRSKRDEIIFKMKLTSKEETDVLNERNEELDERIRIRLETVTKCLNSVLERQLVFSKTGGSHACASFTSDGAIERVFEDVGRHNAFDKLVGSYIEDGGGAQSVLGAFVSGRASFELVQKSIRAGFPIMIAVGAPSTLAVDLAKEYGLTLGCFAKNESITLFSGVRRVME